MEDSNHHLGTVGNDSKRRCRAGRNLVEINPSAQEMKYGTRQRKTYRIRANEDRDPKQKEG